jgi:hypothetical protein
MDSSPGSDCLSPNSNRFIDSSIQPVLLRIINFIAAGIGVFPDEEEFLIKSQQFP